MAWYIDVVTLVSDGWDGAADRKIRSDWIDQHKPASAHFIRSYTLIADLVGQIRALMAADPEGPCLRTLEIKAHGCHNSIDSVYSYCDLDKDLAPLKTLPWCDTARFYLAGCNTGLSKTGDAPPFSGPVAKDIAASLAYDPTHFPFHLTVFGSRGYMRGGHLSGAAECSPSSSSGVDYEVFDGAVDATGEDVWLPFKNGSW